MTDHEALRNLVVGHHDLQVYTDKILRNLSDLEKPICRYIKTF